MVINQIKERKNSISYIMSKKITANNKFLKFN